MKKSIALILSVIFCLFAFTGCEEEKDTSFSGAYNGFTVKVLDTNTPIDEVYPNGENCVLLNEDYTGVITVDGESIDVAFTLEGDSILLTAANGSDQMVCQGTLSENLLEFDFFGTGIYMSFTR